MQRSRNVGLDVVRSVAIILVLICHSSLFMVHRDATFITYLGVVSVELFFVLSGFLIGRIIINSIVEEGSLKSLGKFYISRMLRTLPLYYLLLIVTAMVKKQSIPISCWLFVQNFDKVNLGFLPVSWSLSIEEWFYFLAPLVLLISVKMFSGKFSKKNIFFAVGVVLCLIPFGLRIVSVFNYDLVWDFGVRKQIFLRMDAIMLGMILAGVKQYMYEIYDRVSKSKICLWGTVAGFIALGFFYHSYLGRNGNFNSSRFWKISWFSILPLLGCFLVMCLENNNYINKALKGRTAVEFVHQLSVLSYAIYLIHWNIYEQISAYYKGWLAAIVCTIVSIIISKVVYELLEKPIMKLRHSKFLN